MGYNWNCGTFQGKQSIAQFSTLRDRAKNQRQHIPHIWVFPSFLMVVFGMYGFSKFSKFHNEYRRYIPIICHIYGFSNGCIGM